METITGKIPPKVWLKATDILAEYCNIGEKWVKAGKPKTGDLWEKFNKIEKEYNEMADRIWFAKWSPEQRKEWEAIYDTSLNPL